MMNEKKKTKKKKTRIVDAIVNSEEKLGLRKV